MSKTYDMNIDVVTPSICRGSGGVGVAVLDLYSSFCLRHENVSISLLTVSKDQHVKCLDRITHYSFDRIYPKILGLSPGLVKYSFESKSELSHMHGIWMATTLYSSVRHRFRRKPYILSPHGMLDPWILERGKLKKSLLKILYEDYSWRNAAVFHALNTAEAHAIKTQCPNAKVVVIPNGITIPEQNFSIGKDNDELRVLFLGRFHPKKNLHNLVAAVNTISESEFKRFPFKLIIAGWGDETYEKKITDIIAQGQSRRFELMGPVFGQDKDKLLKNSDAFILPSYSEGLPVAVLEAWAYGLPVLMSKHCNLEEALNQGFALDTGTAIESIANAILELVKQSSAERDRLSAKSYAYVAERYNWNKVCSEFYQLYKDVARI